MMHRQEIRYETINHYNVSNVLPNDILQGIQGTL
jgi:hypothetical protein